LCLFGDNAYINTPFMATPHSATTGGSKDAYNFYHSQLRINIECAFGRLVARWSILRSAIPQNITIAKTTALVIVLAKLHNFCINESDAEAASLTDSDANNVLLLGAVPLIHSFSANMPLPLGLLNGGDHFDDLDRNARRRREREEAVGQLPRQVLHSLIEIKGLTRPAPIRERH
jgi:DDE superfamily endonuclease